MGGHLKEIVASAVLIGCGSDDGSSSDPGSTTSTAGGATTGTSTGSADATTRATTAATGEGTDASSGHASTGSDETMAATSGSETTGGSGDTTGAMEVCEAPGSLIPCDDQTTDPFAAIGLGCPGDANEAIPIAGTVFAAADPVSWRIARQLGTFVDPNTNVPIWSAREGEQFLLVSSGHFDEPDAMGVVTMPQGSHQGALGNGNPDDKPLPAPMSAAMGSNNGAGGTPFLDCDTVHDCSDSLQQQWTSGGSAANDLLWFQLEVDVPGGTHGFSFEFAYFSAEFPEWVGTTYNDIFVVWSDSETYTGNLCFIDDQPCTVTALWPVAYQQDAAELQATGFDGVGGGTGWYVAKGSAAPGETLQLTWAIFDMGDEILDTAVIIDNFAWDCEGCVPSEVDGCGIEPT